MTQGHGDDAFLYPGIRMNFSSNIYAHADLSELEEYLCSHIHLISRYPEPEPHSLEAVIARRHDIPAECVLATNGATEAIYLTAQACSHLFHTYSVGSQPTFSEYADASEMYGMSRQDGGNLADSLLWLCNPNNPTGTALPPSALLNVCRKAALAVVDQSYEDYTLTPMLTAKEALQSERLILIHSLTKTFAIPGLRIGYITASPRLMGQLRRYVRPWSVNALAIAAGKWLIAHDAKAIPNLTAYLRETARLRHQLNLLPGIRADETDTNFMLAHISQTTAATLKAWLAQTRHILIRDASNFRGLTPHHFRVATQSPDENQQLVVSIRHFVERFGR